MSAVGKIISGLGSYQGGRDAKRAAYAQADQMEVQAKGEVAAASYNAERIKRKMEQFLSEGRTRSARGGQSSGDATSIALAAETVRNASLDQLLVMAEAEERARTLRNQAYQTRLSGRDSARAGALGGTARYIDAGSTIADAGGPASWAKQYGVGR